MFITQWKLLVSVWTVRNTPCTQIHSLQKGTPSLIRSAALGAVSEKKHHQPAAPSLLYLIPTSLFKQNFSGSGDSFPHSDWEAQEAAPGRCSKGIAVRRKRMLMYSPCFCSVPFPPCSVHKCALDYTGLTVFFWLWLSSIKRLPPPVPP